MAVWGLGFESGSPGGAGRLASAVSDFGTSALFQCELGGLPE